ncbi:MAG: ABC transporter ATP-binding protein/permease [Propionibacteriaceae bacterium]|jgi:ATP-binding cassette subfamily B protein|nr:ABC transporter ATP-binding protein/permease [Propionibacteriaceae bacterium]
MAFGGAPGGGFGGGRAARVSARDESVQRAINAASPRIDRLGPRVVGLFRPYRWPIAGTVVLVLVGAAVSVWPPLLTQRIFDQGLFPAGGVDLTRLIWLLVVMVGLLLLGSALGIAQTWLTSRIGNRVMGDLRARLFERLQQMELAFFTRTKTGVIQSRLANDVGGVSNVLTNTVTSVVGNTVTVVASFVTMAILSWQLTLIALVLTPILVLVQRRVGQVRARVATLTQESLSEMTAITQEALSVSGVLLAKTFGRQGDESRRYGQENDRQVALQVRQQMTGQRFFALVQVFVSVLPALIYLLAGLLMRGGQVDITAGVLVAFTAVQARLLMPMMGLLRVALDLQTSAALFARIFEYLDLDPAIQDAPDAVPVDSGRLGWIEFDQVSFRYPDSGPDQSPTLDQVSFTVEPGQFVAFVGPSGAGKTTIGYLLARLHEASSGQVRFAGQDVRRLRQASLIDHIGVVSQQAYLFHASIADNLRYAKPEASLADLAEAARQANIADTIASFPLGFDTVVGEQGYRLSGGERQRLAIARVILKDAPVLLLDEATSALDSVSERIVQAALEQARRDRTTVAIAHRLSTVSQADVIYVLERGRIVEAGRHLDLVQAGGLYARLWAEQAEAPETGDRAE